MPVDSTHPQYDSYFARWSRCRDCVVGEDAVKAAGEKYLPKLGGQDSDDYSGYKMRAMFYGAAHRTVEALSGMVFRKQPTVKLPKGKEDLKKAMGSHGESLDLLATQMLTEVLTVGRRGAMVDMDPAGKGKPFVSVYDAEDIINWEEASIDGKKQPVMVVLREQKRVKKPEDRFKWEFQEYFRVLRLVDGVYTQEIHEKTPNVVSRTQQESQPASKATGQTVAEGLSGFSITETITPLRAGGKNFNYIPFVFIGPDGLDSCCQKPPLLDLVNVNLSHYRTSADLEHGRHFTALPVAWAAGFETTGTTLRIGSAVAWTSQDPSARAGYLEFTGAGLGHLKDGLADKEKNMATLGARLLQEEKRDAETAETMRMKQGGEQSVLSKVARSVSEAMTQLLKWLFDWQAITPAEGDVMVELNQKYSVLLMAPEMLTSLLGNYQSGGMSFEVYFHNLQQSEIYPDDHTIEKERELIASGGPMSPAGQTELEAARLALEEPEEDPEEEPTATAA